MHRVFDDDKSGTMDFGEFVLATNCTSLSDPQEKVRWPIVNMITWYFSSRSWIFDVFDEDGGGTIELDEVIKLVRQSRRCTLESLNQYVQLTPPGLF